MKDLVLNQPELVGRGEELGRLRARLDAALQGKGSTVLIAGEAGIGKTRLTNELIKIAEASGAAVLKGWCLAESMEPLMPIREMLRGANLHYLVAGAPPPKVISAYLINEAGMLITESEREGSGLDPDIFAAMLKAVSEFVKDSLSMMGKRGSGGLNSIGYDKYKIIIQTNGRIFLAAVIEGADSEFLVDDMKQAIADIGNRLDGWSGRSTEAEEFAPKVSWFVQSGKYDGKFLVDDPKLKQENLFDNVLLGIQRASAEKPLILFLDDLQWADPTTLNLLHYLARNTRKSRALILGTYRPEDVVPSPDGKAHTLETAMQNMSREDLFERIELKRLGAEDTEKVVQSILGKVSFEKTFFEKVHRETEGTPFFILEVVRLLAEEQAIAQDGAGAWTLAKELAKLDMPSKVYDLVKRRLDRLMKEQRELLECASVIGEEFSTDVLGRTTGTKKITLLKNLSEIEKTHKLVHYLKGRYRFDHAKIREVLYDSIGEELRREYHRLVGDTIAELQRENIDDVVSELAFHYYEAKDGRAARYLVKAGDRARDKFANDKAINAYRHSLEFVRGDERTGIQEKLGDVLSLVGEYDRAIESFQEACDVAKDDETRARMLRKIGESLDVKGELDKAMGLLARAKGLARGGSAEHARITLAEGSVCERKGEFDKGFPLIKAALAEFEASGGDQRDIGTTLKAIGTILLSKGEFDEALRQYEKSLAVMEGINDMRGMAAALNNMGIVYHRKGEQDRALETYGRSLAMVEKIGFKQNMATTLNNIGNVYLNKGMPDKALEFYGRSLQIAEKVGDRGGVAMLLNNLGIVLHWKGELDRALESYGRALAIKERIGDKSAIATSLDGIGLVYHDKGELEKALEFHGRGLAISLEIGFKRETIDNYCGLAEANYGMGNIETALEQAKKAVDIAVEISSKVQEGVGHRILGMAYRAKKDWRNAMEELGKANGIFESIGEKRELARMLYEYAVLYRDMGKSAEVKGHLEKALSGFEEIGMRLWAEKARKALEQL